MRILGIDTSGKVAAGALYDSAEECLLAQQLVYTKRTHSQVILPLAERILTDTGLTWQDVDGIAVAKGPGSYTGLRIGIAAVKAMCFALHIPCVGISTLAGLGWQCLDWHGIICPVTLARQTLVYAGIYRSDGKTLSCLQPDGMLERETLRNRLAALGEPVLLTGDAGTAFAEESWARLASPVLRLQNGTGICLAAAHGKWHSLEELLPEYLQLVKAEKDLQEKQQNSACNC